jgi:hypothetical protein
MMLVAFTLVCALAASDSTLVTQVFRGHGAAAYDQWLHRHAADYPGLRPIHVQIDSEVAGDSERYTYYVSFLDDSGGVVRRRTIYGARGSLSAEQGGDWFHARTSANGDALFVSPKAEVVSVYGPSGDSIFTSTEGVVDGSGDLYFRQFVDDEAYVYRDYYEVLDRRGRKLCEIPLGCTGEDAGLQTTYPFVHSRKATYVMQAGLFVSVIDRRGKILWRTAAGNLTAVAMAENGQVVAVATPESLVVGNLLSGKNCVFRFPEARLLDSARAVGSRVAPHGPLAIPAAAVSGDGSRVAVFWNTFNKRSTGAGTLDVFTREGKPVCLGRYLTPGLTDVMGFAGDGMVFVGAARPARESLAEARDHRPRRPSNMVHWRITEASLSDSVSATELLVEHTAVPRLVSNAVAFYGRDSIYVYRVGPEPTKQRK